MGGHGLQAADLIARLDLTPHPEGGWFRETYRAAESIPASALPDRFTPGPSGGSRSVSTAIYFLLEAGQRSRLHRIRSDEVWHFYAGDPLVVAEIAADGTLKETLLGPGFADRTVPQHVVPAGAWFGAYPAAGSRFALVGCTVAPGFDFADFELAERDVLLAAFAQHRELILRLT